MKYGRRHIMTKEQKEKVENFLYKYLDKDKSLEIIQYMQTNWVSSYHQYEISYKCAIDDYNLSKSEIFYHLAETYKSVMDNIFKAIKHEEFRRAKRTKRELMLISVLDSLTPIERSIIYDRLRGEQSPRKTNWAALCEKYSYGRTRINEIYDSALEQIYKQFRTVNKTEQ